MNHSIFCTLFNQQYLPQGLALYRSLEQQKMPFKLYVLAMDQGTEHVLKKLCLKNAQIISLPAIETDELLAVKAKRSIAEYCWTCTSQLMNYVLAQFNEPDVTYVDADMFFFNPWEEVLFEQKKYSLVITAHNYTPRYDQTRWSGPYVVQYIKANNDEEGRSCLKWWAKQCLENCSAHPQEGHLGDQRYLEEWSTRYQSVHVLKHIGLGVAPWNVNNYPVCFDHGGLRFGATPLIAYHFHGFKLMPTKAWLGAGYHLSKQVRQCIYAPYLEAVEQALKEIQIQEPSFQLNYFNGSFLRRCQLLWSGLKGRLVSGQPRFDCLGGATMPRRYL